MQIKEEDILIRPKPLEDLLLWAFFINLVISVCLLFEISWVSKLLTFIIVNTAILYWRGFLSWEAYLTNTHYHKKKHFSEPISFPYESFREIYIGKHHVHRQGKFHVIRIFFKNRDNKKEAIQFLFDKKINYKDKNHVFNKCSEHLFENRNNYRYKLFFEKDEKWIQVNSEKFKSIRFQGLSSNA